MDALGAFNGKTVVVTGASGYIGSVLVDLLIKHSGKVIRVSRLNLSRLANVETIQTDVRNPDTWTKIVERADIIYHLAGNTSVYDAANNPAESLNSTLLPLNHLIKAAQELKRQPKVIFASTATVYGLTPPFPVAETVEPKPITVYDLHKLFAEQQLLLATKQGVLNGIALRLANVYGPSTSASSADDRGILNRVTAMALQGKDLTIYGDGSYLRDYVYISDVAQAFMLAGLRDDVCGRVFNVASGKSVSLSEAFNLVAVRAARVSGVEVDVNHTPWPEGASAIEFRSYVADINCISTTLGWQPAITLEAGIDCMIDKIGEGAVNG